MIERDQGKHGDIFVEGAGVEGAGSMADEETREAEKETREAAREAFLADKGKPS